MRNSRRRKRRGLVSRRIVYRNRRYPHERPQELKVDVPPDERMDSDYAAAMVAVRTSLPLAHVQVITVEGPQSGTR